MSAQLQTKNHARVIMNTSENNNLWKRNILITGVCGTVVVSYSISLATWNSKYLWHR